MKKLLTLVFAIALSSAMLAQDAPATGTTPTSPTATPSTDASATSKTNTTIKRHGQHSKGKRQQIKTANGASEQREMRTNGKIQERRETKTLKNGKVVTRKQKREVK